MTFIKGSESNCGRIPQTGERNFPKIFVPFGKTEFYGLLMNRLLLLFALLSVIPMATFAQWGISGGIETRQNGDISEGYVVRLERPFSYSVNKSQFSINYSARLQAGYYEQAMAEEGQLANDFMILEGHGAFLANMELSRYFVTYFGYGYNLEQIVQTRETAGGTSVTTMDQYYMGHGTVWGFRIRISSLTAFWERRKVTYLDDQISQFSTKRGSIGIGFGF